MTANPPSRVSLFWQKNGWLGLIFVAAGVLLLAISFALTARFENRLEERERGAAETVGTVLNLIVIEPGPRISDADRYDQTSWLMTIEFTANGTYYVGSEPISEDFFDELSEGQSVPVRYRPEDPDTFWVNPYVGDGWSGDLRFLGYLALLFGAFLVRGPWIVAGQELQEIRRGQGERSSESE